MTISTHSYSAVVKRPGKRDAILAVKGGSISLDGTRSPHVRAALTVAVPAGWAPLEPIPQGHWEPTGAPQYPFIGEGGGPPFTISQIGFVWVWDDVGWANDPYDDDAIIEVPDPASVAFINSELAPSFHISPTPIKVVQPPRPAELRDIDPREAPRVEITASVTHTDGAVYSRVFNLVLRERTISQEDGTIELLLASDETLINDYAPLVDDYTPTKLATLQDVVTHVLGAVLDDVAFESAGTTPLMPAWTAQNLLSNPSARWNVDGWTTGHGASAPAWSGALGANGEPGFVAVTHTASAGKVALAAAEPHIINSAPGRRYVFRLSGRSAFSMSLIVGVEFHNDAGAILESQKTTSPTPASTDWAELVFTSGRAPAGTTRVVPIVEWHDSASGRVMHLDCALLDEGEFDPGYFDGSTTDTATYQYGWRKDADTSPSSRKLLIDATNPGALVWRAGTGGMDFLRPLVQSAGYRLVCREDRAWSLITAAYIASGETRVAYAENMISGSDIISRDADWFDAAVVRYEWMTEGIQQERVDTYALNDTPSLVRKFTVNAPYPGPGFAEYVVARAQGRSRDVTTTSVADWSTRAEMSAKIILNGALPQVGVIRDVAFNLNTDEMTITVRTTDTETPA